MGFGSSALRWEELPNVAKADGGVPPWKGKILWDVTVNTTYVHPINFLAPGSSDMFDANDKAVDYLYQSMCQSEFYRVHIWLELKNAHAGNADV
jgi:hypothetical protein